MIVTQDIFSSHSFFLQNLEAFSETFSTLEFFSEPNWSKPLPDRISQLITRRKGDNRFPHSPKNLLREHGSNVKNRIMRIAINISANCTVKIVNSVLHVFRCSTQRRKCFFRIAQKYGLSTQQKSKLWQVLRERPSAIWVLNAFNLEFALDIARYTNSRVICELVDLHTYDNEEVRAHHIELFRNADQIIISSPSFAEYYDFAKNGIEYYHRQLVPSSFILTPSKPHNPRKIVFFGNFSESRKIDLLLQAVSQIENVELSLFGRFFTPEYEATSLGLFESLGLQQRVSFGFLERENGEGLRVCSEHDIGLILFDPSYDTSHKNALPTKLGTYLAAGLDIITVRTEAIEDSLRELDYIEYLDTISLCSLTEAIERKLQLSDKQLEQNKNASLKFSRKRRWDPEGKREYLRHITG